MAKKPTITAQDVESLVARCDDLMIDIAAMAENIRSSSTEPIPDLTAKTVTLSALSRDASSLALGFLWLFQYMNKDAEISRIKAELAARG